MGKENDVFAELIEQKLNSLGEKIELKLDQIHEQTKKTNGRVNKLEAWQIEHELEMSRSNGQYGKAYQKIYFLIGVNFILVLLCLAILAPNLWEFITKST